MDQDRPTGGSRAVTIGSQASGRAMASLVNRASLASLDRGKGSRIPATKRRPADQGR